MQKTILRTVLVDFSAKTLLSGIIENSCEKEDTSSDDIVNSVKKHIVVPLDRFWRR